MHHVMCVRAPLTGDFHFITHSICLRARQERKRKAKNLTGLLEPRDALNLTFSLSLTLSAYVLNSRQLCILNLENY